MTRLLPDKISFLLAILLLGVAIFGILNILTAYDTYTTTP